MSEIVQIIDDETGLKKAFIKPSENRLYDIDVGSYMRAGDNIFSADSIVGTLLSGTGTLTLGNLTTDYGDILQFRASAGSVDTRHKIEITFTTAAGDTLEADLVIEVKEDF